MREKPIIPSILDNDFYKFTMQYAVVTLFPKAKAKYTFINRGKHAFPPDFAALLRDAVDKLAELSLSETEKKYLAEFCPYLDPTYLDFLQGYRFNPDEVSICQQGSDLSICVSGFWYRTILWEVPLLALICELFYKVQGLEPDSDDVIIKKTKEKISLYKRLGITIAEFGTRRRHAYRTHSLVVQTLKKFGKGSFIGSSNVHMAMLNNTKPIGTHAHEWFMFHAAKYGFKIANKIALENWVKVYRGDLGIALSDTYTTDAFFAQFDKMFTKLFDGVRHDSGDPLIFAEKAIHHYKKMGIDPTSKTIIFSDSLNPEKVEKIVEYCKGRIGMSFGIGTDFTNDVGLKAMNIVIKMSAASPEEGDHWVPVVKLSDDRGKYTGDEKMIALSKQILGIPTLSQ